MTPILPSIFFEGSFIIRARMDSIFGEELDVAPRKLSSARNEEKEDFTE
jgi:hypothetical protein